MRKDLTESDLNIIIDSLKTKSDFDDTLELANLLSKADWDKKITTK